MNGFKKFLFYVNDLSNAALSKDRQRLQHSLRKLKIALVFVAGLLVLSLILNLLGFLD